MDHLYASDALVNRDEPIPVIQFTPDRPATPSHDDNESPSSSYRDGLSPSKLKDRLQEATASPRASSPGVQDRLFAALFHQIIPNTNVSPEDVKPETRSKQYVERPNFSLPVMSQNFRRFNARIGVVFVFENRLIRLFSWRDPSHTVAFLAVYTFCCLNPNLLIIIPLAACLFLIMVPAFVSRHPPPPNSNATELYALEGPASAPPKTIKPAPEMSKDFFRNMRDLQNSMEDFSRVHDKLIKLIAPVTNFSDEQVSSTLFLFLFLLASLLFIASNLIPWRAVFLIGGWSLITLSHPTIKKTIAGIDKEPLKKYVRRLKARLEEWMKNDIILDEMPELREVEIFELQRQRSGSHWEPWVYGKSPYTPQSPLRIAGDRPRGTRFFEDVQPPKGWEWHDKKWTLDLQSRDWVEERMITAVEVETEGERWVYDIGASDFKQSSQSNDTSDANSSVQHKKDWEESSGLGPKGEWRRRRWVRLVRRKVVRHKPTATAAKSSS